MSMLFDPHCDAFRQQPYQYLAELRDSDCRQAVGGGAAFFDYSTVDQVMSDTSLSVRYIPNQMDVLARKPIPNLKSLGRYAIVFTDPPLHHRLRRLHMSAFNAKAIDQYKFAIEEEVRALLSGLSSKKPVDIVSKLANEIPKHTLTRLLGIDPCHRESISTLLLSVRTLLEPSTITPRKLSRLEDQFSVCVDVFEQSIQDKRRNPCDDMISELIAAEKNGERLTDEEIVISCALTYIAGHETTKSLIASGMKLFLEHPEQWSLLRNDRELLNQAIEEIARFEPPLHFTTRVASKDFKLDNADIKAGDMILLCIASANRDPQIFDRPNEFDISREVKRNLAFGSGMHNCIGKVLAIQELKVLFNELLDRNMPLHESREFSAEWLDAGPTTRSLETLEMVWPI